MVSPRAINIWPFAKNRASLRTRLGTINGRRVFAQGAYLNLHVSARLGERTGYGKAWPEWLWWNNAGWSANVARFNGFEGQRFLPDVAKEFQIAMTRWPPAGFRISLDLETSTGTEFAVTGSPRADGKDWLVGQLSP